MSTAESIWDLISSGDLFGADKLAALKSEYAKTPPGQSDVLAWLIGKEEITEYHSKVFSAGHNGPFRYGEYVVNDRIAEGYFKGGFRAQHDQTGHPVILDFATGDDVDQKWARLKSTTNANTFFASPFLIRCFEAVENDDYKFLVFEDFEAVPITSILAKSGHLKPKTACDIIRRVAFALQTIHQAGYSHGHVCSKNIRIQNGSVVKLFFDPNFYFIPPVKANSQPDPHSLVQVDYAAPELAIPGNRPDELTDIYALGCLFYELLSGKPPFPIGNIQDRMQQHATQRVKPLENLGYDKSLAQFVYFMMAKDRSLRFQSVADVIKQLNALKDSGNTKPSAPKQAESFDEYDKRVRAKIAAENVHTQMGPVNLLPSSYHSQPVKVSEPTTSFNSPEPIANQQSTNQPSTGTAAAVSSDTTEPPVGPATQTSNPVQLSVGEEDTNTTTSYRSRQKSSLKKTLIPIGITLAVLAIPLYFVYLKWGDQMMGTASKGDDQKNEQTGDGDNGGGDGTGDGGDTTEQNTSTTMTNVNLIEDDQRTLWESPTGGDALNLDLAPAGMRLLLSVRGEKLFANDTESLLAKSLGPDFMAQTKIMEEAAGISWKEAKRVNFSVHDNNVDGQDNLLGAFVVAPVDQKTIVYWLAKWGDCTKQETPKGNYYTSSNGWAYYTPDNDTVTQFLVAPESLVKDFVENGAGLLNVGFGQLIKTTDQDRHLNLVVVPTDLTSPSGVTMFKSSWLKLNSIMSWYMGGEDKIQAAYFSLHFDGGDVYMETGLKPQLDKDPYTLSEELRARIEEAPAIVNKYMLEVDADRHWRQLAWEIPRWVKNIVSMSRVGVESNITIANCWQDSAAAHNLFASLDYTITFAEGGVSTAGPATPTKKTPQTIEELLTDIRTIEIANDDLNIAVDKIVEEIKDEYPKLPFDFQITINGTHLMDEGITKNQRLVNFKVENKPLGDILAQFVFTATTDKTSTGPSDPKTMLIWVIHEPTPGKKIVLITTRTAAAREGYTLPKQFVPK